MGFEEAAFSAVDVSFFSLRGSTLVVVRVFSMR